MAPKITLYNFNGKIKIFEAIDDFNKCPTSKGVWCLYGYNGNSWKCLQVARSNDISTEIRSDIAYITALNPCQETPYTYINHFAYNTQALYWRNGGSYKSERIVNVTELLSSINPTPTMVDAFHKMNTYIEEQDEFH